MMSVLLLLNIIRQMQSELFLVAFASMLKSHLQTMDIAFPYSTNSININERKRNFLLTTGKIEKDDYFTYENCENKILELSS